MKAIIIKEHGVAALADIKEQSMRPDYIKIKTVAVALNQTDWHHTAFMGRVGGIVGCDVAGIVEEVGTDCKSDVKPGDAVYGVCHGANMSGEEDGAFAEYAMIRDGHIAKIPKNMTFEETSTLGVGLSTVGQTLYMTLKLPLPGQKPIQQETFILIYGGSTATGTLAIQCAKLSGLTVVTTASPENFELVKSRGADMVFDYHDAECAQKIREYTKDSLCYVLDCISTEASFQIIAKALPEKNEKPMRMVTLMPADAWPRQDVEITSVFAYDTLGEPFTKFGKHFPAVPENFEYGVMFWKVFNELLAAGKIKSHPMELREGGLAGIIEGIAEHAKGPVRAKKLVYKVIEPENAP